MSGIKKRIKTNKGRSGIKSKFQPRPPEDPEVIKARWEKKKDRIHQLSHNISRLRLNVTKDLKSDDEKQFLTALIIAIIDKTGERIRHGSINENITEFLYEKMRKDDYDAPFNGFWFTDEEWASPAMVNPRRIYSVFLNLRNPAPHQEWKKAKAEVYHKVDSQKLGNIKGRGEEVRKELMRFGYDGVIWEYPPAINKEEFEKYGRTEFYTVRGKKYWIEKGENESVELYDNYTGHITGYLSVDEVIDSFSKVFVVFYPYNIKLSDGTNTTFDPNNPDIRYADGGIPERYKNMGFSRVGQKKRSTRPEKKWMVLAKKGDRYKVVHGGQKGMEDFSQHRDKDRQKRFWNRMGGFDSEKASDPFSPLYWHKRFGTWEKGGALEDGTFKVAWIDTKEPETLESKMFDNIDDALKYAEGKAFLIMELEDQDDDYYKWNLLPYGEHKRYKGIINWINIFENGGVVKNDDFANSEKSRIFIPNKITKDELQSIISGTSKVANGDTIQATLIYIRREEGTGSIHKRAEPELEKERLKEFVNKNNLWYVGELNDNKFIDEGGEHVVYEDPSDKDFILKTNNLSNYHSWSDYLINLLLNNTFFPATSYELIGFIKNEHENIFPVVRQYYVAKATIANLRDAQRYLFNRGFQKVHPLVNAYRNWDLGVMLGDLHDRNVLTKDNALFFIDTKFFLSHNADYTYSEGGEIKDENKYFASSDKNPIFVPTKITREDVNQTITGDRPVTHGTTIQAALSHLRGSEGSVSPNRGRHFKGQDEERLIEYISKNNLWLPEPDPERKFGYGGEARAYLYGNQVIKSNDAHFYDSWEGYFNSLLIHNLLFPTTSYELIGFYEDKDFDSRTLYALVRQPYIQTQDQTNLLEVRKFMYDLGFVSSGANHYRQPELGIELKDLHKGNVLTKDGALYFIDTIFYIKEPEKKVEKNGKISAEAQKQIDQYLKEGIFIDPTDRPVVGSLPISRFNGPRADILPSQTYVYLSGVNKWKRKIKNGERPGVLIHLDASGISRVSDGHHRLKAYEELGFTNIPVIDKNGEIIGKAKAILQVPHAKSEGGMVFNEGLSYLLNDVGNTSQIGYESGPKLKNGISVYKSPAGSYRYVKYIDEKPVSAIQVMSRDGISGYVANAYTEKEYRRQGHGIDIINKIRKDFKNITLSEDLSGSGRLFKESVLSSGRKSLGGDVRQYDTGGNIDSKLESLGFTYSTHNYRFNKTISPNKQISAFYNKNKNIYSIRGVYKFDTVLGGNSVGISFDFNNEKEFFDKINELLDESKYASGGPIKDNKELAKKIMKNLPEEALEKIKQEFENTKASILIGEEKELLSIRDKITKAEDRRKYLYEEEKKLSFGDKKTEIFEERKALFQEIESLKTAQINQENKIRAIRNGGDLASFTDKKETLHENIPSFLRAKTEIISFDEETILSDDMPPYIPIIDEEVFRHKGYIFDAIRISPDKYIIAVSGHKEDRSDWQNGYVLTTLDQLALINDYYFTKAKAKLQKDADDSSAENEKYYDSLPREKRLAHLSQKGFYYTIPKAVQKKVTKEEYEAMSLEEKEALYKPYKRYGAKRIVSKLEEDQMWKSFHKMYERFVDPEAREVKTSELNLWVEKGYITRESMERTQKITSANHLWGHPNAFAYWKDFREMMKWKIKDIEVQRLVQSEIRKVALETSFGESNTNDTIKQKYGILVKRQDGSNILPNEIEQIRQSWEKINNTYGSLIENARIQNLKISHTGTKYVYASKASGMYIPDMKTIAVSNKFGNDQFEQTMAHEVAHWIDHSVGELSGKRYASDDYESTAGQIAITLRRNMNQKSISDYVNSSAECFARAMEQYFAFANFGEEATLIFSYTPLDEVRTYHSEDKYVSKEIFNTRLKPLIDKFLKENSDWFKFGV